MMFRLATATLLCVTFCIMVQSTSAQPKKSRDYGLSDIDSEDSLEYETVLDAEQQRTSFGKLGSVMALIKSQFKEILQELGLQVLEYLVYGLKQFKVKLLTKFGFYTLSDIFQALFDRVTDFVADSPSEMPYYPEQVHTTSEPAPDFNSYWPLFRSDH